MEPAIRHLARVLTISVAAGLAALVGLGLWWFLAGPPVAPVPVSPAALAGLFPRSAGFQYEPPEAGSYELPAIKTAPDGGLLDHTGAPVRLRELTDGKKTLLAFVYLNCADAEGCPLAMATLWQIFDKSAQWAGLREQLQLVTISFDPQRDTPAALNSIVQSMQADRDLDRKILWRFLTGRSTASLRPLLEGFGQTVNVAREPGKFNHLLRLYLLDEQGDIRNIYGLGSIDPRLIMTDVATLAMQKAGAP